MKKIELLAPAGSLEALYQAIYNGADAVYFGMKHFGARAFAANFDHEEVIEAIELCHKFNRKAYVTMNTMLNEDELMAAIKEVEFLYNNGIDALIVSDLGLIYLVSKLFPDLELHASTQMNINNYKAAKKAYELGLKRIVLARETDLKTIKEVARDFEVEVFGHGALCISYSGQCLMSSSMFKRSGNKGTCAQCCRLQYRIYDEDEGTFIKTNDEYLLSPKDLNTLEHLSELIEANVASIKIEGRMKRKEYVALVTRVYREAIDAYYKGETYHLDPDTLKELKLMFNRGFSSGYAFEDQIETILNPYRPNHIGIMIAEVIAYHKGKVKIRLFDTLRQGDGIRLIDQKEEYGFIANKIYKNDKLINGASKGEIVELDLSQKVSKGTKVYKTSDRALLDEVITERPLYKEKISITYEAKIGKPFKLRIADEFDSITYISDYILPQAKNSLSDDAVFKRQLAKLNDTPYEAFSISGSLDDVFMPVSLINKARREAITQFMSEKTAVKKDGKKTYEKADLTACHDILDIVEINDERLLKKIQRNDLLIATASKKLSRKYDLPLIGANVKRDSDSDEKELIVSELGSLKEDVIVSANFNVANSYALEFLYSLKAKAVILSFELNDLEITRLKDSFYKRHGFLPAIYRLSYGKRDLMYLKIDPIASHLKEKYNKAHTYDLVDLRGDHFKIVNSSDGPTRLLENEPVSNEGIEGVHKYYRILDEEDLNILK